MAAVVLSRCAVDPLATDRERRQEQARARMWPPVTKPVITVTLYTSTETGAIEVFLLHTFFDISID